MSLSTRALLLLLLCMNYQSENAPCLERGLMSLSTRAIIISLLLLLCMNYQSENVPCLERGLMSLSTRAIMMSIPLLLCIPIEF